MAKHMRANDQITRVQFKVTVYSQNFIKSLDFMHIFILKLTKFQM